MSIAKPMSNLLDNYPTQVQAILAKYPAEQKRSAVMPLLYLAQKQAVHDSGRLYVSEAAMQDIAGLLDLERTEVAAIVGFYTLYYDQPASRFRLQVCTDLPCALRGADKFLAELCKRLNIEPGETTADGLVTVEAVTCLAACDKAPMFQVQSGEGLVYYENQTVDSAMALVEMLRNEAERAGRGVPVNPPDTHVSARR
jgi:NADH-quinone oxidoreductase subunit E